MVTPLSAASYAPRPPRRFPLPFGIHLPLHLLCLWALTAACSVAHLAGAGPLAAAAALLAQLAAFALSTLLAYRREQRLRGSFLQMRAAAGGPVSPRQKGALPAVPVGQSAAGGSQRC